MYRQKDRKTKQTDYNNPLLSLSVNDTSIIVMDSIRNYMEIYVT